MRKRGPFVLLKRSLYPLDIIHLLIIDPGSIQGRESSTNILHEDEILNTRERPSVIFLKLRTVLTTIS